ncbi:HAD family hydrolase [Marinoscillum sp. 108]|uniref:KdsC family phosphatase n=1 Tax=Marinoscillum sp. 108 TaxID=2653151 RepID=UPI0012F47001|nr:HAD-IIIA family hydrolase [Marinoscillum sp. 108]VXD20662.1 3-deoxy-D-manno-octulosonate 8-phosphate phosphatase KdsC [Marinoscillum sp. 108]
MSKLSHIKLLVLDVDGTMTDGGIYIMEDGRQFKKFHARDGLGIKEAIKAGVEVGIISHSLATEMVNSRANMLGMKHFYVGQRPKLEVLNEWMKALDISYSEVCFIGDDLNDLEVMQKVGFSACPADAASGIKKIAKVVLDRKGGDAAVREFIDRFILSGD